MKCAQREAGAGAAQGGGQVPEGLAGMPLIAIRLEGDRVLAQSTDGKYTRMDADGTLSEMTEAPMIKQDPAVAAFGDAARAVASDKLLMTATIKGRLLHFLSH
ncbi:MAG: hypothetical protein HYV27_00800 [Candidatus Hydrogenedentes bacterium]|nr:hypothetical protein [Candidatus Hydrogenedentota bacterium]